MDAMDRAAIAAKDDAIALENLISDNQRFILVCAARTARRFVTRSDDEWSAALMAFHEAVKTYDEDKGSFKSFAALIIRRRVTDYMRGEMRHAAEIPVEPYTLSGEVDDEAPSALQMEVRDQTTRMAVETEQVGTTPAADEIEAVQQILGKYGFSFFDLADCSPKAGKTKEQCALAVQTLLSDPEMVRRMQESCKLPILELSIRSGVQKKLLERHRKYLIAAVEILSGDYPILSGYLKSIRKAVT